MSAVRGPAFSLRTRFALGVAAMILPPALLVAGALFSLQSMTAALEKIVDEVAHEMQPIARLQTLLLRAAMSLNDHLIHDDSPEHERLARLSRDVDRAFQAVTAGPFALAEERAAIQSAQEEWRRAKTLAGTLLALPHPQEKISTVGIMRQMDTHIDQAVDTLEGIHELARQETDEALSRARVVKWRATLLMAGLLVVVLVIAVWGGITLARAVFTPLLALARTADRFAGGDLSQRVDGGRMPDELGRLAGAFNAMAAKLQESRAALETLASRDGLTGLYNHRTFYVLLADELARAFRFKRSVSLLMVDADHFKRVNDTYGHPAGDAILKGLSELLGRRARSVDRVCRYGGEEIAVILPETGLEGAAVIANRLRAAVEAQPFDATAGASIRITVSIGVASYPAHADSAETLVAAADAALYAAKQGGRNRVIRHETGAEPASG
ncbi:MAG: diguanylate cyclase [Phycisphaeraceae bacterium]